MTSAAQADAELLSQVDNDVQWITLNRPAMGNALSIDQREQMIGLLEQSSASLGVRAVVITATGRHFCTGADLRAPRAPEPERPDGVPDRPILQVARSISGGAQRLIAAMLDCEKPVVAAVNGTAAGIGAHLALAADLVIAAEPARFIEVFVRRGIAPDGGGAWLLTRLVGMHKAKELVFFGDDLSAAEAERLGLVNKVVASDQLEATARAWAERLAAGPTKALTLSKWLINRAADADRNSAFGDEAIAQDLLMTSADANEGVQSFRERREPTFRGW